MVAIVVAVGARVVSSLTLPELSSMSWPSPLSDNPSCPGSDGPSTLRFEASESTLSLFDLLGAVAFFVEEDESEVGTGETERCDRVVCSEVMARDDDEEATTAAGGFVMTNSGAVTAVGEPSIEEASSLPSSLSSRLRFCGATPGLLTGGSDLVTGTSILTACSF